MATIDSWDIIEKVIEDPSFDPFVVQVVTYINAWGNRTWAVLTQRDVDQDRYRETHFVQNPQVIWSKKTGQIRDKNGQLI